MYIHYNIIILPSAKRVVCNEKFEELLTRYLELSELTLANEITEACMDEAFKEAEYNYNDVEADRASTINDGELVKQPIGESVNSNSDDDKPTIESFDVAVTYTKGTELMETKISGWRFTGGLSAEYHVGMSAGVSYHKQQSVAVKSFKGEQVQQTVKVKVPKGGKATVLRKLQRKQCLVRNIKLSFAKKAQISCCYFDKKNPNKEKTEKFYVKDILTGCSKSPLGFTAKLEGKYVWVETEIGTD